jgi:1-acyl-sn-glycerol-3-phosphate acyltransferase
MTGLVAPATTPGFPTLATAVTVARTARGGTRVARAAVASLSALGEARIAPNRTLMDRARALTAAMRDLCTIHAIDVDVIGVVPERPCVIAANHLSYLDPLVILSQLPAAPIAKAEVADWPLIGPAAAALGVSFVDRASIAARVRVLRRALGALRDGVNVLNFPEGTTTDGSRLLRFHRGIFGLAMLAGVPVVPVAIAYDAAELAWTGNATFLPHYWKLSTRPAARARLIVRAPMWPRAAEQPEDFALRVRTSIALALDGR